MPLYSAGLRCGHLAPISGRATSGLEVFVFTGIVTALGDVRAIEPRDGLMRITIEGPGDPPAIGASVAHDGCCLTVVAATALTSGCRHVVEVAAESLAKTTLGALREGDQVNLERSLRAGDELGGHLVMGHV